MVETRCQGCGRLLGVRRMPSRCPVCGKRCVVSPAALAMLAQAREEVEAQELSEHPVAVWIRNRLAEPKHSLIGLAVAVVILFLLIDDLFARFGNHSAAPTSIVAPAPAPVAPNTRPVQPPSSPSIFSLTGSSNAGAPGPLVLAPGVGPSLPPSPVAQSPGAPTITARPTAPPPPPPQPPFAALSNVVPSQRPPELVGAALDELIGQSISHGANWLISQFDGDDFSSTAAIDDPQIHAGAYALCVDALLQAGLAVDDDRLHVQSPFMTAVLKRLKTFPMDGNKATYSRSLRLAALEAADRPDDHSTVDDDAGWLADCSMEGAFTYGKPNPGATRSSGPWDNSNSQYGALGMWAACNMGFTPPPYFWSDVVNHWEAAQSPEGGWGYHDNAGPTLSMTCAGVSILFVARDLSAADSAAGQEAPPPLSHSIERGLSWLDQADRVLQVDNGHTGYTLYGLERAGLASGYKYFGKHDWYLELARRLVKDQSPDGHWEGNDGAKVETAFRLLFLARGRHPILLNKLRYDGHWADRPRDAQLLAAAASRLLERPLHWQVVGLDRSALEWSDCPVLYISGDEAPSLTDDQLQNLRDYVQAGGLIFTHSDNNSEAFTGFAEGLSLKLFGKGLELLPTTHPLYSAAYVLKNPPPLRAVDNGSRLLMVHSPQELNRHWSPRYEKADPTAVEAAMNILLYAHGRREFHNRISSLILPPLADPPIATVPVARIKYAGNWDPEPGAWTHFARQFQGQTGIAIDIKPIDADKLTPDVAPLAHLTGTDAVHLDDAATAAIKHFVQAGGVLLVDDCGSAQTFGPAIHDSLLSTIAGPALGPLYLDDPLLQADAPGTEDASHPRLRTFATSRYGATPNRFSIAKVGRGTILYTDLNLTSGLLGTDTWGIYGFTSAYSHAFLQNLLLWTMHNAKNAEPQVASGAKP